MPTTLVAEPKVESQMSDEEWVAKFMKCDRQIIYRRRLVDITGNALSALFMSQACYWQQKMGLETWWWKTSDDWQHEMGLSRREFQKCRTKVEKLGLVETSLMGMPAKTHWRVRFDRIRAILDGRHNPNDFVKEKVDVNPEDSEKGQRVSLHDGVQTSLPPVVQTSLHDGVQTTPSSSSDYSSDYSQGAADADARRDGQETESPRSADLASEDGNTPELPADTGNDPQRTYGKGESRAERIRRKAAMKATQAAGRARGAIGREALGSASSGPRVRRGGLSSSRARSRKSKDSFEAALAADEASNRRADPIRRELAKRKPVEEPEDGAPFDKIEAWARDRVRLPRRHGGGLKEPDEWVGRDLDGYLIDLVVKVVPGAERPHSTGKSRGQAKNLIVSTGGEYARDLVAYAVENWVKLQRELDIQAAAPSCGILLGFLESVKAIRAGKTKSKPTKRTGANRVASDAEYDEGPSQGWG